MLPECEDMPGWRVLAWVWPEALGRSVWPPRCNLIYLGAPHVKCPKPSPSSSSALSSATASASSSEIASGTPSGTGAASATQDSATDKENSAANIILLINSLALGLIILV
ncbi:unnamed protein product [Clonostachys chloroleuca]|uniref:Uncharacterized protein n=1 Tax=Clonostachys chloroleuca TaxID=1926264 RepID=A0AA35PVB9_9HYPO|nr:unnamed protein product [Clonostachys chloroleuca]